MNNSTIPTEGRHALRDDTPPPVPQPTEGAEGARHAEFPTFSGDLLAGSTS
ncbi:MAG: hypothetical protein HOV94_41175 [Saccharothrix sp.]|nr:hypothetical protein [Saccharothrix sp.]